MSAPASRGMAELGPAGAAPDGGTAAAARRGPVRPAAAAALAEAAGASRPASPVASDPAQPQAAAPVLPPSPRSTAVVPSADRPVLAPATGPAVAAAAGPAARAPATGTGDPVATPSAGPAVPPGAAPAVPPAVPPGAAPAVPPGMPPGAAPIPPAAPPGADAGRRRGAGWLALALIAMAGLGQWLLAPRLGTPPGFVLAYPAVMLAAWYGGFWPGALVTGALALLLPVLSGVAWDGTTQAAIGLTVLFGLLGAALTQSLHHARQRWQARADAVALTQQRLAAALHSTGTMLLEFDAGLRCTWLHNPPPGLDAAALPGDAAELVVALRQVLATGEPLRVDVTLPVGEPPRPRRFEHRLVALRGADGRIHGLRSAASDVTELRERQAREAEAQALFRAAQERSPDAFELLRPLRREDGVIEDFVWEYVNPAGAALVGRSAESLVGQRVLARGADRFQRARFALWCEALAGGEPRRGECAREEPGRSLCNYQMLALPLGERLAALTSDATAPTRSLEAEREQSAALQRAAKLKDDFLAHLSHELRTPLNAITGWAHLLTRAGADAALLQRAAEAIGRNAHAQAVLVDALLDMNRVVTGSLRLQRESCDLSAALQRALATAAPLAQAKWIRLHTEDLLGGVMCNGDPARLEQVFWNLLSNAVKFTPLGGDVWVTLERVDAGTALVEVRDSGEGVAAALLPHFFDRFQQQAATGTRPHAGLGLGLTLVRSLVELHGGRVSVHSDGPGLGTTVRVHLPTAEQPGLRADAATAAGAPRAAPAVPGAAKPNGDAGEGAAAQPLTFRRILVLEDEADSLEVLSVLLRQQGAVVRAFDNAEQALAAAEHGSFDLVISDLGMPGMNGLEFMRRLQRRPLPLKAIALTAYAGESERAEALKAGYTRVETKPISPPQFLAVVLAEVGAGAG